MYAVRILCHFLHESVVCPPLGVAASQDQDFGTANLHVEVSDVVSVLVYVGVAKGNGVLSKTGKTVIHIMNLQTGWTDTKIFSVTVGVKYI